MGVKRDMIEVINPTNEKIICKVYAAGKEDVNAAVYAAKTAFKNPAWRALSGAERANLMRRLADLIDEHTETLAVIETVDSGKPLSASRSYDVPQLSEVLRYYAGWADKNHGQTIDVGPGKLAYTIKEPLGVCAQIMPWNYPLAIAGWKLGPALCCGNTVVLKIAEQTPLSMLYVARLIAQAGFPPGVVNIISGHGNVTGSALVRHKDVAKVSFTGSTAIGVEVMKAAAGTLKNVTLETGGKSPLIVFADAKIPQAVHWAHEGALSNQGQMCTATSRILVHERILQQFTKQFVEAVKKISVVGDPFANETFQGPQISKTQYMKILAHIKRAKDEGATVLTGGKAMAPLTSGKGFFIEPTVITNVRPNMHIYREEVFGPCVVIVPFSTDQEAIMMANDTAYGLGAAVFTQDIGKAHRVVRDIEAGMVWINSSNDSDVRVPFGGVKMSGIGRELGEAALQSYSQAKAIHVNLGEC
ncbi:mitochondrial aldehyde dehydrogenase [Ceratocystis pirilliformis]|uniref:Mitochondrial aldehyde dehydrogenase n=1 Tax=Ceratocystis pirilliformis TaxID=259994 RepID=A0ABR3ZKQ4_9PEZI